MTAAELPPTSLNRRAAKAVALYARDHGEARLFLDIVGLVEPSGSVILPDDTRHLGMATVQGTMSPGQPSRTPRADAENGRRPAGMTTPPGLAVLPPPVAAPARKPATTTRAVKPAPAKTRAPKTVTPRRQSQPCGTMTAYRQHRRRNEPACDPCAVAARAHWSGQDQKIREQQNRVISRNTTAGCGTRSGYEKHRRLHEPTCPPCRAANAAPRPGEQQRLIAAGVNPNTAAILAAHPTNGGV